MKINDLYESEFLTNEDEILKWMKNSFIEFHPKNLKIESDGIVYDSYLNLRQNIDKLKVQFKEVGDWFSCRNTNIISLEGCPRIVGRQFNCSNTNITSLKFCPQIVVNDFYCSNVKITDPKEYRYALYSEIGGIFESDSAEISRIINKYAGPDNRKYWPHAINLLSKVVLK